MKKKWKVCLSLALIAAMVLTQTQVSSLASTIGMGDEAEAVVTEETEAESEGSEEMIGVDAEAETELESEAEAVPDTENDPEADTEAETGSESGEEAETEEGTDEINEITENAEAVQTVKAVHEEAETEGTKASTVPEKTYTAEDAGVKVTAVVPEGALPADAELSVTVFSSGSKEYKEAAEAIDLEEGQQMTALDISFMVDDTEVEPAESVQISIDVSAILPSNADVSTLEVQHLKESRAGQVKAEVVASDSPETEGTIDVKNATAEFEVESFSSFTITWTPETGSSTSTIVTVYVYDMNGLGIYDAEPSYELTADSITISDLVSEHASSGISGNYTFVYATAQYLTTSNQGGSVTTIGSMSDPVSQITWNGTSYVVMTSSGSTTVTKTDTVAAEFYINLYFSTPTVTIAPTAIESGTGTVTLTATTEYFPEDEEITYTWEIIDGEEYASITGSGDTATVTWTTGDEPGSDVTVRVTAASTSEKSATATYELEYGMQRVTYTVYLPDSTTVVAGAHVSITDESGKLVSYGTTDSNGQVTLWVTAGTEYTLEASYTASSGSGIAMTYTHYTYENKEYKYNADEENITEIVLEASEANFYEHVDVKLSIADQDDENYSDILANVDYITIYDESGEVVYRSIQMVHNAGTNDYNVLFGDENGNSRGDNNHSIAFYDTYTIEIAYEVTYTYTDEYGDSATYTETYVAEINSESTYIDGEYYSYSGTNAYQLYNELNGTSITEEAWEAALAAGTMDQLLGDGYNEHGIDISGQTYFFVAAALCDTRDTANQAGLDLALGVDSLRRYSSTAWNFEIQKTLKNADMTADQFTFDLYAANIDGNRWYIDASEEADNGLQQEYTNSEASLDGTESTAYRSGTYVFNLDSSMVGIPQIYYFVLFEEQGNADGISYDDTVYGITVTVTLNDSTDMANVTIEESYCILKQTSEAEGYIYYEVSDANPTLGSDNDNITVYPFVNTYSEYTDITVEKVWNDNENGYETRPESITVTITGYVEGVNEGDEGEKTTIASYTLTLNDENEWKATRNDLPVFAEDGSVITYEVTETDITGYNGNVVDGGNGTYTITNTLTGTTEITVTKNWVDSDNAYNTRPNEITVNVTSSDETDENTYTLTLNKDNNWTDSLTELPKYDSTGTEITYTVSEVTVPGYVASVEGYEITNTLETVDLSGTKTWVDQNNKYELRPDRITIQVKNGDDVIDVTEATSDNNWEWSVTGLPKYESDGTTEISYTVNEVAIPGYTTSYDGYDITNTLETVNITGTKTWDDASNQDGKRVTEITVNLLANGDTDNPVDSITVTGNADADTWNWSFTDLPKYDSNGAEITYTVTEDVITDYETEITGSASEGFVITNKYEPGKVSLNVSKVWIDNEDSDGERPGDITVTLVKNGEQQTDQTLKLNEDNDWSGTFEDLDEYTSGVKNEYSVAEVEVDDYVSVVTQQEGTTSFIITNTHESLLVTLTGTKVWIDNGEDDSRRPDSITVNLYRYTDEEQTESEFVDSIEVTPDADGNWTWTFENLPKYHDHGHEYVYYLTETDVDGYESVIGDVTEDSDEEYSDIITNTALSDLSLTKEVSGISDVGVYKFEITLTTPDGDPMEGDVAVTYSDGSEGTLIFEKGTATVELKAGVTATLKDLVYATVCTITEKIDGEVSTVTAYVGDEVVVSVKGTETEATADVGTIADSTQVKFVNSYRAYYPIDEEIVTDTDDIFDRDAWVKDEAVSEYNAIEIEMTTNLPTVTGYDLANGEFTMNFHEVLDHELVLDEDTADFSVYIGEVAISTTYYRITFDGDTGDDCNFHVDVDLTALYNDGIVTDNMLDGNTEITIFFFADLEGTGLNGSYTSTIWYDIYDRDEWLYTSNESVIAVYTYEIEIQKYDASTLSGTDYAGSALTGATFGVYYDVECKDPVIRYGEAYTEVSSENGMVIFYGLADGTYYVKEIEAPEGYVLSDEVLEVELGEDLNDTNYAYWTTYANTPEIDQGTEPEEPADSGDNKTSNNKDKTSSTDKTSTPTEIEESPQTGDSSHVIFYSVIVGVSALALIVAGYELTFGRRKREDN